MTISAFYVTTTYGTRDKLFATTEDEARKEADHIPHATGIVKITMQEIQWSKGSTSKRPNTRKGTTVPERTTL